MVASEITVKVQARVGWTRFLVAVAQTLTRLHMRPVAACWLWLTQPTFVVGLHVVGQYHRLGPLRWRRWSYRRVPITITLQARNPFKSRS